MILNFSKDYVEEDCCNCGVSFFITSSLYRSLKRTKNTFYCPNGHAQSYRQSEADELKEQLIQKNNLISSLQSEITNCNKNKRKRK